MMVCCFLGRNKLASMQKWKETLQSIDAGLLLLGRNELVSMQKWKETLQSIDDDLQFFFNFTSETKLYTRNLRYY